MAVTRDGIPVRCWTFPGDTGDQKIIRKVKDDLGGWNLRRLVWVADRGFASAANRAYLARGGGHYIHAEKLRGTNAEAAAALARQGRYRAVAGNLRVKEVWVPARDAGERAERFVVCHNPEQAERDQLVRDRLVTHLEGLIDGSDAWTQRKRDELAGSLKDKPGLRRFLRRTPAGCCASTAAAIRREAGLDGKWLLRTNDDTLTPDDLAAAYKQLIAVERGWRDMKGAAQAAARLPLPRGPHPRPRPAVLAGAAAHPGRRDRHQRHLAQPAARTRPDAPGHPRHHRRPGRPALRGHPRPAGHPPAPLTCPNHRSSSTSPRPAADLRIQQPVVTRLTCGQLAFSQVSRKINETVCP